MILRIVIWSSQSSDLSWKGRIEMNYQYLILDLDNTLYPKMSGMLSYIDRRIDNFIAQKTRIPDRIIPQLRSEYLRKYGTTLGGMIVHYEIDPGEYLENAYNINIADFLKADPLLGKVLAGVDLKKVIFSNSPLEYVKRVLEVLGVNQYFHQIYDIKFCDYWGKPNLSSYRKVLADLQANGAECIMVDDSLANVLGAKQAGITPILLSGQPTSEVEWVIGEVYEISHLIGEILQKRISA